MKKLFPMLITLIIAVSAFCITVSAAETFTDTVEDGFPKAHSWSDHMCFQYNDDMECTILVKQSDTGSPSTKEHIIYKTDSEITGFSLDCMHVNGLGNGTTDIKVFVSSDCANWSEVAVKATEQVFDDEIYIDFDHAYWLRSTVSNKDSVLSGCTYIKIEIEPFTVPESCTWNTVIDTVNISLSGNSAVANVSSGNSEPDNTASNLPSGSSEVEASGTVSDNSDLADSSNALSDNTKPDENTGVSVWVVIVIGAVAVAAIAVAVFVILKNGRKPVSEATEANADKE